MSSVGKNIQKFRKAKNITQEELAEELNVTRQAVSNWETDKTQPDVDTLTQLSEALDVTVEELIYGEQKTKLETVTQTVTSDGGKAGISFGAALAMVISYAKWQSIGWAIVHGILGWVYVIYYIIKY
ncbi:MAG: helix-turn-helix transcriptional regulator [Lachnospiraceae bacterium]|nr:helix-turn-helix transcriptional regulator [Lachnospiraceae bacterium]